MSINRISQAQGLLSGVTVRKIGRELSQNQMESGIVANVLVDNGEVKFYATVFNRDGRLSVSVTQEQYETSKGDIRWKETITMEPILVQRILSVAQGNAGDAASTPWYLQPASEEGELIGEVKGDEVLAGRQVAKVSLVYKTFRVNDISIIANPEGQFVTLGIPRGKGDRPAFELSQKVQRSLLVDGHEIAEGRGWNFESARSRRTAFEKAVKASVEETAEPMAATVSSDMERFMA